MRNDQEARERERVGPARDGVFRELAEDFKRQIGLPEGTTWRELSEDKVRIPSATGLKFVDKLWQVRNARRGGNQWDSVSTAKAINAFKPVKQAPDWRPAFYEMATPEEERVRTSTKGTRKLQLAHNPNTARVLDKVLAPASSSSPGPSPVSSGSAPVSSAKGDVDGDCNCRICHDAVRDLLYQQVSDPLDRLAQTKCCGSPYHRRCLETWWQECERKHKTPDCPWCKKLAVPASFWTSFMYKHETLHWRPKSRSEVIDFTVAHSSSEGTEVSEPEVSEDVQNEVGQSEAAMETEVSEPEVEEVEEESADDEFQPPAVDEWDPPSSSGDKSESAAIRAQIDEEYEQAEVDDLAAKASKGEFVTGDPELAWAVKASLEEAKKVKSQEIWSKMVEVRNDQKLELAHRLLGTNPNGEGGGHTAKGCGSRKKGQNVGVGE